MKAFVATVILLALVGVGASLDWKHISVDGLQGALNDQVGYIAVSRHWAAGDGLRSSFVYPSLLLQKVTKSTLYMPGFYWALGLTFKLFGYSAVTARLPSLVAYLLACVLTWWIARRVYGERVAGIACTLFAFFPLCMVFAFTAMAETVVAAAGLASFAIFLWGMGWNGGVVQTTSREQAIGDAGMVRRGTWIAPLAIIIPLVFRETGVVVGLIMVAMLMRAAGANRWRAGASAVAVMAIAIAAVLASPIATGRPSLWKANILSSGDPQALYADAYAMERVPAGPLDWAQALGRNLVDNARNLVWTTQDADGWAERTAIWFLLSGIPLGLYLGVRENDWFAGGVTAATAVLLLADLSCYDIWGYRGVRALLVMAPFLAMLWAKVLARWIGDSLGRQAVIVGGLAVIGFVGALVVWRGQRDVDAGTLHDAAFMESIGPETGRLLVSPFDISLGYLNEHYPARWAFPPSDCRSLQLLDAQEAIGTLVLRVGEAPKEMLDGCGLALRVEEEREYNGTTYRVLRR
jgi:hypothetical protein